MNHVGGGWGPGGRRSDFKPYLRTKIRLRKSCRVAHIHTMWVLGIDNRNHSRHLGKEACNAAKELSCDVFRCFGVDLFVEAVLLSVRAESLVGIHHPRTIAEKPPIQNEVDVL